MVSTNLRVLRCNELCSRTISFVLLLQLFRSKALIACIAAWCVALEQLFVNLKLLNISYVFLAINLP